MSTLSSILSIGRSSLQAQQKAISVTGNNIANVNTPGYTRQRADLENGNAINGRPGQMGGGVNVAAIQRMHDRFLTGEIRSESQDLGEWEARKQVQDRLEIVFNESDDEGLNKAMHGFWNAWQDLSNNPAGSVERSTLISKSQAMADRFRSMASDLSSIETEVEGRIGQAVSDINEAAQQIAQLNDSIRRAENLGQEPNDLKDRRDEALKAMSKLADVSTSENGSAIDVTIAGEPLVEGAVSWDLSYDEATGFSIDTSSGPAAIADADITSGTVGGLLAMKNDTIPDYRNRLNDLAGEIISAVNDQHYNGYDLEGHRGIDFFVSASMSAADMAVNPTIVNDHRLIAAAMASDSIPGDGGNALAIADIAFQPVMNGTETFSDFYTSLVADVGNDTKAANSRYDLQQVTMGQLETYRDEVSGVSLDEEMVNLVQFQNAYAAAAKLISATDEMLDTLINMV